MWFYAIMQERKLVRLASYRQLQAISHQLSLATAGRIANLDFFSPQSYSLLLRPIQKGESRTLLRSPSGRWRARLGETMCLPESVHWWKTIPLLVLQLDQGSIGCAGCAKLGCTNHSWTLFFWKHYIITFFLKMMNTATCTMTMFIYYILVAISSIKSGHFCTDFLFIFLWCYKKFKNIHIDRFCFLLIRALSLKLQHGVLER